MLNVQSRYSSRSQVDPNSEDASAIATVAEVALDRAELIAHPHLSPP